VEPSISTPSAAAPGGIVTKNGRACGKSARRARQLTRRGLFLVSTPFFDHNHLASAIVATARANVMRLLNLAAVPAADEGQRFEVVMATAVALTVPADLLFRKCAH